MSLPEFEDQDQNLAKAMVLMAGNTMDMALALDQYGLLVNDQVQAVLDAVKNLMAWPINEWAANARELSNAWDALEESRRFVPEE